MNGALDIKRLKPGDRRFLMNALQINILSSIDQHIGLFSLFFSNLAVIFSVIAVMVALDKTSLSSILIVLGSLTVFLFILSLFINKHFKKEKEMTEKERQKIFMIQFEYAKNRRNDTI